MQRIKRKDELRGRACVSRIFKLHLFIFPICFCSLFVNAALTLRVELYPPLFFIPPLALFLPLHLLFLPPLPPELCLPPLSLHFPPTFLSHSKELSVSVLPFIYCFNMLAGGERRGCCARPSVLSCHLSGQRKLPVTPTQLPVVSA